MKQVPTHNTINTFVKVVLIALSVIVLGNVAKSQTNYLIPGKKYSVVKLSIKNQVQTKKVRSLTLENDTILRYKDFLSGTEETIPLKSVRFISEKTGTYALPYGLAGAGLGLLSALYGISSVKADPTLDDSEVNWTPFVLGFTAGGAAIGALIGACIPKYQRLYLKDNRTTYFIRISPNVGNNYCAIGLTVNF